MPELPEVEAIRRVLEPQVQGCMIREVAVEQPKVIERPSANEFSDRLIGQSFDCIERRGKFLRLWLKSGDHLVLHLRMSGCLLLTPADMPKEKHTHLVFLLDNGKELRFSDTRRFGRWWLIDKGEADVFSNINRLGKEPFDPSLDADYLQERFGKRKKPLKECLLAQDVIAGIGNIYADEILFACGLAPTRLANTLTMAQWERLAACIPQVLSAFIARNEMTPKEYLISKGQNYRNTPYLQVYGREGAACPLCREALCRCKIGGRSSFYCPHCQT